MRGAFFVICLTIYWLTVSSLHTPVQPYDVVQCCSNQEDTPRKLYLLFKNTSREVPDEETAKSLGFEAPNIKAITTDELQSRRIIHPAVEHIPYTRRNPDEIMAMELARIRALTPRPLMHNLTRICQGCKNPAVLKWHGQLFALSEVSSIQPVTLQMFWANSSAFPVLNDNLFGFSSNPQRNVGGLNFTGIDPRICIHPVTGNVIVVYSRQVATQRNAKVNVFYTELSILNSGKLAKVVLPQYHSREIVPDDSYANQEKNWAPFFTHHHMYSTSHRTDVPHVHHQNNTQHNEIGGNGLLFVQSVQPLHIVSVKENRETSQLFATTISKEYFEIHWNYGSLRSGTNPVRLHDRYIAFFHSVADVGSGKKTYFYGAYAFTLHPPYKVIAYSPLPIALDSLYTGPWMNFVRTVFDYVLYPVALFLEDKNVLHLSLGHNDAVGFVCQLRVDELLESMLPV